MKYKNKEGVSFWAEKNEIGKGWIVVAQAKGYPATEAFDDWFTNKKDAQEVAKKLNLGLL